jgi:transcriptional regulator with PAS, ATPase and Fis domain
LVAASNQPIEEMVKEGRFRKDLFYRLNVIRLHLPPLRERRGDIIPIAENLLRGMAATSSFPEIKLHPAAQEVLLNYDWPGNIRELVNVLSRVTCLLERDTIQPYDIPFFLRQTKEPTGGVAPTSLGGLIDAAEKDAVLSALASAGNNKTAAAALLGIHRTHLYKKIKKYGI